MSPDKPLTGQFKVSLDPPNHHPLHSQMGLLASGTNGNKRPLKQRLGPAEGRW